MVDMKTTEPNMMANHADGTFPTCQDVLPGGGPRRCAYHKNHGRWSQRCSPDPLRGGGADHDEQSPYDEPIGGPGGD